MKTKLTLRLDEDVIGRAKAYAAARGTSLSALAENYFRLVAPASEGAPVGDLPSGDGHGSADAGLSSGPPPDDWRAALPPLTRSLVGIAAGSDADEDDYKGYLAEKHR